MVSNPSGAFSPGSCSSDCGPGPVAWAPLGACEKCRLSVPPPPKGSGDAFRQCPWDACYRLNAKHCIFPAHWHTGIAWVLLKNTYPSVPSQRFRHNWAGVWPGTGTSKSPTRDSNEPDEMLRSGYPSQRKRLSWSWRKGQPKPRAVGTTGTFLEHSL